MRRNREFGSLPVYPAQRCILVHIPKTAGGSLGTLLNRHSTSQRNSILRRITSHLPVPEPIDQVCIRVHDSAAWLRLKLGPNIFDEFETFAVVRNPYDRLISIYEFVRQFPQHRHQARYANATFEEFLQKRGRGALTQTHMLCDRQGKLLVKHIARFETLERDVNALLARFGFTERLPASKTNTSVKKPRDHYLTPRAIALINDIVAPEFEMFGYERLS